MMAESQAVAKQALEKLEEQLTYAICLDGLPQVTGGHRQTGSTLPMLPTCRQATLLPPATSVSGLHSAFHVHHLFLNSRCTRENEVASKGIYSVRNVRRCHVLRPAFATAMASLSVPGALILGGVFHT